ncbi:MAG: hypothetical protein Q9195_004917 [Heterodermia aff. obscurata]
MSYRLELAKSNRSGCSNTECKKNGDKIEKGALRHGVMVTIKDSQTWKWRHWGCVSPRLIANMKEVIENNFDYLDGYDELSEDVQETVRRAFEQGHVDDEDWKGVLCPATASSVRSADIDQDVEQNRPGAKGFRSPAVKKKKKEEAKAARDAEAKDDEGSQSPSKPAAKKRGRGKKEEATDIADTEQPPAKKAKGNAKKEKKVRTEADSDAADAVDVPVRKTKAAAKKNQKSKGAEAIESDGAPPPKKARGTKKSVKADDDEDQGESVAKEEDSGAPIPAPAKKSRAPRKAAVAKVSKDPEMEEDGDMEEVTEEIQKPKKGRKNIAGKGAKDELTISLTPPRPHDERRTLSPAQFLTHQTTIDHVNRRSFLELNKTKAGLLSLHPSIKEKDSTMAQYLHRVFTEVPEPLSRVHVTISGDDVAKGISDVKRKVDRLESRTAELELTRADQESRIAELELTRADQESRIAELQLTRADQESRTAELELTRADLESRMAELQLSLNDTYATRLQFLFCNLAIRLTQEVASKNKMAHVSDGRKSHSTIELERFSSSVTSEMLDRANIPIKFLFLVQKLPLLNRHRNQIAHESQNELARLLMKPCQHDNFERFQELFPILYGATIQEIAAEPNEFETLMMQG